MSKNGYKSNNGSFESKNSPFTFSITQGAHSSYASILTPDATYKLKATDNDAWLYNPFDLIKTQASAVNNTLWHNTLPRHKAVTFYLQRTVDL